MKRILCAKVLALILVVIFGAGSMQTCSAQAFAQPPTVDWLLPVTLSGEVYTFTRSIGGSSGGTSGFDELLDETTPPPGQTFYAHLWINSFPYYLDTDIRAWVSPYSTPIDWILELTNTNGATTDISWDPALLPPDGRFYIITNGYARARRGVNAPAGAYLPPGINMRDNTSTQYSGDGTVTIHYEPELPVVYEFGSIGWYLVGLPVDPLERAIAALFPGALGGVGYEWSDDQSGYVQVSEITPTRGLWLAIAIPGTVTIKGVPIYYYYRTLAQMGWYLITSIYYGTSFPDLSSNPNAHLEPAYGWTPPLGPYYEVDSSTYPNMMDNESFWLAVSAACELYVGSGQRTIRSLSTEEASPGWGEFIARFGEQPPPPPFLMTDLDLPEERQPMTFEVSKNYPNPFNPETTIEFTLPSNLFTRIDIYNVRGERVRTLVNEVKPAGQHRMFWDGRLENGTAAASGTYLIRVSAGEYSETLKALLLK